MVTPMKAQDAQLFVKMHGLKGFLQTLPNSLQSQTTDLCCCTVDASKEFGLHVMALRFPMVDKDHEKDGYTRVFLRTDLIKAHQILEEVSCRRRLQFTVYKNLCSAGKVADPGTEALTEVETVWVKPIEHQYKALKSWIEALFLLEKIELDPTLLLEHSRSLRVKGIPGRYDIYKILQHTLDLSILDLPPTGTRVAETIYDLNDKMSTSLHGQKQESDLVTRRKGVHDVWVKHMKGVWTAIPALQRKIYWWNFPVAVKIFNPWGVVSKAIDKEATAWKRLKRVSFSLEDHRATIADDAESCMAKFWSGEALLPLGTYRCLYLLVVTH